ncbi:MAG: choice-of-anchor D domain-containing protein [Flavobacterium sp.]|nr:choice-of-anchor D domain-containing protein [Flavobacterium sp.]
MKVKIVILFLFVHILSYSQLLQWNTFGNTGLETTELSVTNNVNLSSSTLNLTGSVVAPAGNLNRFGGNNWAIGALSTSNYIQFTVTPNSGFSFTPTSFVFSWDRSASGPSNVALRSSVDGYVADLGTVAVAASLNTGYSISIAGLNNLTTATTFRLYGYGATGATGTGGFDCGLSSYNVILNGTTASTAQPEMNVVGNGSNILDNDLLPSGADHTDFGASLVGVSFARTFTIQNVAGATADLNLTGAPAVVAISGANAADFVVSQNPAPTTIVGASTTFQITFTPSAAGVRSASLTIPNNDNNENPYNFNIQGTGTACTSAVISTVFPLSGPVGTVVAITASSGSLLGATAKFNGVSGVVVSSSATQLFVTVPAGATTGNLVVSNAALCPSLPITFTVISSVSSGCQGVVSNDLIIYEVHDEFSLDGGTITIFNGTASTKNMSDYRFYRTGNQNDGNEIDYGNLTGSIAPGALGIIKVSVGSCGPASTNGTIDNGFNENDGLQLRMSDGVTVVDDVDAYVTMKGYYMKRNVGAYTARTSYVAADWTTITLAAGVCAPGLATAAPVIAGSGAVPSIVTHPTLALSCTSSSATLSVSATEGFNLVGDIKELAYEWYVVAPNAVAWSLISISGNYADTDANPSTLNIASLTGLNGYQYYCRVKENDNTCYIASNAVKINNGTLIWNGTDWRDTNNIVGIPSITKIATINGTYNTFTNGSFDCCSLIVNNGYTATIAANTYINVQNNVTMVGTGNLIVDDNGSLVQVSDTGVNTGSISLNRIHTVKKFDYVYLASPVNNFPLTSVSPTTSSAFLWKWIPTVGGFFGNWVNTTENMITGKGYIVRGPSGFNNTTAADYTVPYRNVPNNGVVAVDVERGGYTGADYPNPNPLITDLVTKYDDNWNLVGNPYPSAIDAKAFMTYNTNIEGVIRIWTHGNLPSAAVTNPFYGSFTYNYTASDFILYNLTGPSVQNGYNGYIPSGQGFFVAMLDGPADATQKVYFNNSMRSKTFDNSQFFRLNGPSHTSNGFEKSRIWLDLVGPNETVSRTMIGYVDGATTAKDRLYDALLKASGNQDFYSIIDNEAMNIQGRPTPFDRRDKVSLGLKLTSANTYKIAISSVDGLFLNSNRAIYLEDKVLHIIHNLKQDPYTFTSIAGKFDDRFVLRYTNSGYNSRELDDSLNMTAVAVNHDEILVESTTENINKIFIYDLLGREIYQSDEINSTDYVISNLHRTQETLLVKILLNNGLIETKKILY